MTFKLRPRRFLGIAALAAVGLCVLPLEAEEASNEVLDLGNTRSGQTAVTHPVPELVYSVSGERKPAAPLRYKSVSGRGFTQGLRHRLDALWSGASDVLSWGKRTSDMPQVAKVKYRLRSSPWSDPERMREARLLSGTEYQQVVNQSFGSGRTLGTQVAAKGLESLFANEVNARFVQNSMPVQNRKEMSPGIDFLESDEVHSSDVYRDEVWEGSDVFAAKLGFGADVRKEFDTQVSSEVSVPKKGKGESLSAFDIDASAIWTQSSDVQYTLTFDRSVRPSLLADSFVESETIAFSGNYTISDMWATLFGAAQSSTQFDSGRSKEIFSGEMALEFSATESVNFSGGHIYRSASLGLADDEDAENILRFSTVILY